MSLDSYRLEHRAYQGLLQHCYSTARYRESAKRRESAIMDSTVPDDAEHTPTSVCPPGGLGGSRTSTSPFVSNRLMAFENKSTDKGTKRPTEGNGYSGMHEATVLERMRLFTSNNSSRSSSSPRVQEEKSKRVLREDWIKESTPVKSAVEDTVPEITYKGGIPIPRKLSISQARTELPIMLAHVKVSERASNFNILDEGSSLKKNVTSAEELPSVLRNFRAAERSSSISLMDPVTTPPRSNQIIEEVPQLCRDVRVSERMTTFNSSEQDIVPKNIPPSDRKILPSGSGTAVETSVAESSNNYSQKRAGADNSFGWTKVRYISLSLNNSELVTSI